MSETHVAHAKPLSRMQTLSESRGGGSKATKPTVFSVIAQSAIHHTYANMCTLKPWKESCRPIKPFFHLELC